MPISKIVGLLVILTLLALAYCGPYTPANAQEGTPYPTQYCFFDPEGNWVCFSGTNDLTTTPTPILSTPFVPTATPVPTLTPTATIVIQPADICIVFYCLYLPIGARL